MKEMFANTGSSVLEGIGTRRAYAAPKLTVYGVIADFTAGGSGMNQENQACNGPILTMQNKC